MNAESECDFPVCGDEVFGWTSSPSGQYGIYVRSGHRHDGRWCDVGLIHIQPRGGHPVQIRGYHRPWEAVINDVGHSAVSDHGHPEQPSFHLLFLDPHGSVVARNRCDYPAESLILSPDGLLVVLSVRPHTTCYELQTGKLRWSIPECGDGHQLRLVFEETPRLLIGKPYQATWSDYILKVDLDGNILERWPRSGYEAITIAEAARQAQNWDKAERWFALAASAGIAPSFRAKALRAVGDIRLAANNTPGAIHAFRSALEVDPRCGVKRLLASLQRSWCGDMERQKMKKGKASEASGGG